MYSAEHVPSQTAAVGKTSSLRSNGHEHKNISEKQAWSLGKGLIPWYAAAIDRGTAQPILYKLTRGSRLHDHSELAPTD